MFESERNRRDLITKQEAKARVTKGAALLDQQRPGWAQSLEHQTIEMASCYRCVLGRLYGEYTIGRYKIGREVSAIEHGFYAESCEPEDYAMLHECWIEAIAARVTPTPVTEAPAVAWTHREVPAQTIKV